jgi:phage shock protein E
MKLLAALFAFATLFTLAVCAEEPKPAPPAVAPSEHIAKNVTPDEAETLLRERKGQIIVLDVRTPEEFAAGHIAGARNVDFLAGDFADKVGALDPSKSYLVHCASGGRSNMAVSLLKKRNFVELYHMNDGFKAWVRAGKAVEK